MELPRVVELDDLIKIVRDDVMRNPKRNQMYAICGLLMIYRTEISRLEHKLSEQREEFNLAMEKIEGRLDKLENKSRT